MINDKTSKELFDYVRTLDTANILPLKEILSHYNTDNICITDFLDEFKSSKNILLIDARSESEFAESSLPASVNFPVLNNFERHNVGLIYKKYSQISALLLAMKYADPKNDDLQSFLNTNDAHDKKIYVYCWRGGGRSGYLSKMITDLGLKPVILTGGYKAYRQNVNSFFAQSPFPYSLLELSGLTGCGKTELLENVSTILPVINLESAALHFSSLLGHIPYEIKNVSPVPNQSAFENNLYSQVYLNLFFKSDASPFLIESESKRVGKFEIPKFLYERLQTASTIKIICSMEIRCKRIVRDYFGKDLRGIVPMINILKDKERFFKQQLSNNTFNELLILLNAGKVIDFTEIMISEYYDKKYKEKNKTSIGEISTDNMDLAVKELLSLYKDQKVVIPRL
ncbi:MAG: tRNA 2-selenouridine(34) synthase MnmH [bacterium]